MGRGTLGAMSKPKPWPALSALYGAPDPASLTKHPVFYVYESLYLGVSGPGVGHQLRPSTIAGDNGALKLPLACNLTVRTLGGA